MMTLFRRSPPSWDLALFYHDLVLKQTSGYTGFVVFNVLQGYAALSYFPETGDSLWLIKCGLGYFYQRYQFDPANPTMITQGMTFIGGLGWCWKLGICIGLDYIYNLCLHSNGYYHQCTQYAEHTVIFSVSYKTALPGKEE